MLKILVLLALVSANVAQAQEVKSCDEVGVGLTTLVTPVAKNSRGLYFDKSLDAHRVYVYNVDLIEPAAASGGLAFVLPDHESEVGDSKCLAITYLTGVDVMNATISYDDSKGVLLTIPAFEYDHETGDLKPSAPLKVRVSLKFSSVTIE